MLNQNLLYECIFLLEIQYKMLLVLLNQLQMSISNLVMSLLAGFLVVALLFHYPLAIGITRACAVKNKRDCIMAGNHPAFLDDVTEAPLTNMQPSTVPNTPLAELNTEPKYNISSSEHKPGEMLYDTIPGTPKLETSRF